MSLRKNISAMTFAYAFQKALAFVFFSLVARSLSVPMVGVYSLALSFASLFGVFADLGISNLSVREFSQDPRIENKLSGVFSLKLCLSAISFVLLLLVSLFLYPDKTHVLAFFFAALVMVSDALQSTLFAGLRSRNDLRHEALSIVLAQTLSLLSACLVSFLFPAPWSFIAVFVFGSALSGIYAAFVLRRLYDIHIRLYWPRDMALSTLKDARSFALSAIGGRMYGTVDGILLHSLHGAAALGIYSVSTKIVTALQFIPYAFSASLYPAFSALSLQSDENIRRRALFDKSAAMLLTLGFLCTTGIVFFADPVVPFVFGESYRESLPPLFVAACTLPAVFYTFVTGALYNSVRLQWLQTSIVFASLSISVIGNIILIPSFGALGAAYTALLSSFFWVAISIFFLWFRKVVPVRILLRHGFVMVIFFFALGIGKVFLASYLLVGFLFVISSILALASFGGVFPGIDMGKEKKLA